MKKSFFNIVFCLLTVGVFAQSKDSIPEVKPTEKKRVKRKNLLNTISNKVGENFVDEESGKANYLDYKIISHFGDTVLVDTTLNIEKEYRMNFLKKDIFGELPLHNQGQVANKLSYEFEKMSLLPEMGATAKHRNYYQIEDIKYYNLPTPTSEFFYQTGMQQGQVLDTWLAINLNERLNFSMSYKGLRSLGHYRNSRSSHTNFRGTLSYQSKNYRYQLRAHITSQNLDNQENGGLPDSSIDLFEGDDDDFLDRGKIDVNSDDAFSILTGKRYYLDHSYKLVDVNNNQKLTNLRLGHVFTYETKQFNYYDTAIANYGSFFKNATSDRTSDKTMENKAYLDFTSPYVLGNFRVFSAYNHFYHGYQNVIYQNGAALPHELSGKTFSLGGNWNSRLKNFHLTAELATILSGDLTGSNAYVQAAYLRNKTFDLTASLQLKSHAPDFNFLLFQSNYLNYNWSNDFKNIDLRILKVKLETKFFQLEASANQIENYTYFEGNLPTAKQYSGTVNYFKIKGKNEFRLGKFALNNTVQYQKATNGASVFRVPTLLSRNTLYFSSYLFEKKSLFLQTGITATYFSKYQANNYNAVLGDFVVQNDISIGGEPILDVFVNGQIRRTRIYFKAENLLAAFGKNTLYATPNEPYRDFTIRIGIVWNFFK